MPEVSVVIGSRFFFGIAALALTILLASCAQVDLTEPEAPRKPPQYVGWVSDIIKAPEFELYTSVKAAGIRSSDQLTIYIEGDGNSWINSRTPSADPTPLVPVGFELATKDPSRAVAYIARPCQFVGAAKSRNCDMSIWTSRRYSTQVVAATNFAIDRLKAQFHTSRIKLVGYSGGAAVALLAAAKRNDVGSIVTVAGNLDTDAWIALHDVKPLTGSLNPADFAVALSTIPQTHFVGGDDVVVPKEVALSYARKAGGLAAVKVTIVDGYSHVCCWVNEWERLSQPNYPDRNRN